MQIVKEIVYKEKIKSVLNGELVGNVAFGIDTENRLHTEDEFVKFIIDRAIRKLDGNMSANNIYDVEEFIKYFEPFFPRHEKIFKLLLEKVEKYRIVFDEKSRNGEIVNFDDVDVDKKNVEPDEFQIRNISFEDEYAMLIKGISSESTKRIKSPEEAYQIFRMVFDDGYSQDILRKLPDSWGYNRDLYEIPLVRTAGLRDISCNVQYRLTGNSLFGVEKEAYVQRKEDGSLELVYKLRINSGLIHSDRVMSWYGEECEQKYFIIEIPVGRVEEDRESKKKRFSGNKMSIENADRKINKIASDFFTLTNAEVLRTHKVRVGASGIIPSAIVMDSVLKYLKENGIYDGIEHVWPGNDVYISISQSDGNKIDINCSNITEIAKNMTCVVTLPDGSEVECVLTRKENKDKNMIGIYGIDDFDIVEVRAKGDHPLISKIIQNLKLNFDVRETTIENIEDALRQHALEIGSPQNVMRTFVEAAIEPGQAQTPKKEVKGE